VSRGVSVRGFSSYPLIAIALLVFLASHVLVALQLHYTVIDVDHAPSTCAFWSWTAAFAAMAVALPTLMLGTVVTQLVGTRSALFRRTFAGFSFQHDCQLLQRANEGLFDRPAEARRACYVTAPAPSDVADGWRDRCGDGGCVVDVATGATISGGLSMPHSPRWHRGKLWLLNSRTGELGYVELDSGVFQPVAFCPGYLRGSAFCGDHAVVTLSKPRHVTFTGLAVLVAATCCV